MFNFVDVLGFVAVLGICLSLDMLVYCVCNLWYGIVGFDWWFGRL